MEKVTTALRSDLDAIVSIDKEVIGNESRKSIIYEAIEEEKCLVVKENEGIVGFLIYNTKFYDNSFIDLLIVSPNYRNKGYASSLMKFFEKISPTKKIFSSTNLSNETMQKVFNSAGYIKSGFIDNLDEGDPQIIYYKRI